MKKDNEQSETKDALGVQKLERLINLSGELIALRGQFSRLVTVFESGITDPAHTNDLPANVRKLDELTSMLAKVSSDMQSQVMHVKMTPLRTFFASLEESLRPHITAAGKEVILRFEGEQEELDRVIITLLQEPVTRILETIVANGIETPAERQRAGKPAAVTVRVAATHKGNNICIEIADDGSGRVGTANEDTGEDENLTRITDVLTGINGSIDIARTPGRGTVITMQIPLSLAITKVLLVVISGQAYAIPVESITEILKVGRDELYSVEGTTAVKLREHALSLVDLREGIRIRGEKRPDEQGTIKAVVITNGTTQIGIMVDDLIGEDDVVIKQLSVHFKNVCGINGASVLGDGKVALVIDPAGVIDSVAQA